MSIDPVVYRRLAAYNTWMTEKAYQAAERLGDAERKEDRGAFFKSIHSTLNHILFADRAWMRRFTGTEYEVKGMGVDLYEDFAALKDAHFIMCRHIEAFAAQLTSDWLLQDLTWTSMTGNRTSTRPQWVLLTHLFNHQTHHRGQLSTLLSQAGIDIGVTDFPWSPEAV